MGSASVSRIFFRFSSLIVTKSAFVKKKSSKMRHLKKICETNGGQIKEQDVPCDLWCRNIGKSNYILNMPEAYQNGVQCTALEFW